MNYYVKMYGLLPADGFTVPKSTMNWIQHHAMYLGQDLDGVDWIIENDKTAGVRLITADDFFKSVIQVNKIDKFIGLPEERKRRVQTALMKVGKPYDLINYNCEHFLTDVQTGIPASRQVETALVGGIAVMLLVAIFAE